MRSSRTVGAPGRTGTAGGTERPAPTAATADRFPLYARTARPFPGGTVAGPRTGTPGA
ncbi:hypothetical protein [Streptomyces sp. VNUA24]|uniref:hypothetical protein n=1 Tax=Streptomyces sp. VNUA24 TaxID=3031131 RepID=UPI0023B7A96F|nr:hypothetical protein [Streptomyces sp. VNUA24]WEH19634.1 hypothetical protein PYR72_40555 [Streptomyces sp. VNUA24]